MNTLKSLSAGIALFASTLVSAQSQESTKELQDTLSSKQSITQDAVNHDYALTTQDDSLVTPHPSWINNNLPTLENPRHNSLADLILHQWMTQWTYWDMNNRTMMAFRVNDKDRFIIKSYDELWYLVDRYVLSCDLKILPTNAYTEEEIASFASYLVSVPMKIPTVKTVQ